MAIRDEIIAQARARAGIPYRLNPPPDGVTTLDCSLFVLQVAKAAGVPLPAGVRTAEQIRQASVSIGFDEVLPGDLLFFEHTYEAAGPAGPDGRIASHIGISLGAGTRRMWDANDGRGGVGETNIGTDYWQGKLFEARRLPALATATPALPVEHLRGIDVASHQGAVNWPAVAASGIAFAITKATGGTWYTNPTFAANWLGIKAAGLVRGAYHFAFESSGQSYPGDGPEAEADYFLAALARAGGVEAGDLLALDIEDGGAPATEPLGDWALRWCRRVQEKTGIRPLIYTGAWFSEPHQFRAVPALARYPLWLASYQGSQPAPPAPWDRVSIWQFTDKGVVPGISGAVDLNRFNGSREQLVALGKPATVAEPSLAVDPRDEKIAGLVTAVAHLADVVVPAAASSDPGESARAKAEARRIREQFVGPKPAA